MPTLRSAALAAVVALLPAAPALAQGPAAFRTPAPATTAAVVPAPVAVRVVVLFEGADAHGSATAAQVVVADSLGTLLAVYQHDGVETPLAVRVAGDALVLRGATVDGVLSVRLVGINEAEPARRIAGRWTIGEREGVVRPLDAR